MHPRIMVSDVVRKGVARRFARIVVGCAPALSYPIRPVLATPQGKPTESFRHLFAFLSIAMSGQHS
jgi:hypothetical protein